MAVVRWLGVQGVTRKVMQWTCNASIGDSYSLVHNLKVITYTAVTSDTATIIAAALATAAGLSAEPEWQELAVTSVGAIVYVTGPDDGAEFTVTRVVTGSATMTAGSTTNPVSPHDVADNANYSATLANGDTLVIPAGSADMLYNLEAKAAITGVTVIREAGGPVVGLPDFRNGAPNYREYRPTRLKLLCTTATIYTTNQDGAGAVRMHFNTSVATIKIIGTQAGFGTLGQEVVEVIGTDTTSVLSIVNSSVAIAPLVGTVATVDTLTGENSTINVGSGATLEDGGTELTDCTAQIGCNWVGLVVAGNGTLTVTGSANGQISAEQGTVNWNGTGNIDALLGPGAILDLSQGAGAVAVVDPITKSEGAVINDPGSRITVPFVVNCDRSGVDGLNVGRHRKVTIDAI